MNSYQDIVKKQLRADKKKNTLMIIGIIISVAMLTSYSILEVFNKKLDIEGVKRSKGNYDALIQNLHKDELEYIRKNYLISDIGIAQIYKYGIFGHKESEIMYEVYSLDNIALNKVYKSNISILEGKIPTTSKEILIEPIAKYELKKEVGDEIYLGEDKYIISGFANFGSSSSDQIRGITYLDNINEFKNINILFNIKEEEDVLNKINNLGSDLGYPVETDVYSDLRTDGDIQGELENQDYIEETYIKVNDDLVNLKDGRYDPTAKKISQLSYLLICTFTVILVYAYISSSISEKIKQISTLRCMGATPKQIRMLVFKESLILSTLSIIPGVILGYVLTYVVTEFILQDMMGMNLYGISVSIYPIVILKTIVISYLTVLIATIRPASYASKITPIEGAVTKGTGVENIKFIRNKFIRNRFGLVGDIAYRNMRSSKNFIINTMVLSISMILLIVFTSYAQFIKEDIEFAEGKIPSDARIIVNQSDTKKELKKLNEDLTSKKVISNIKNIGEVRHPVLIDKSSLNIEYNKNNYEYIQHEDNTSLYLYGDDNLPIIYTYSDNVFEDIKKKLFIKDVTLEEFKDNGLILVNAYGESPINKEVGDKVNISINRYSQYDVYNREEYVKKAKSIEMDVIASIDVDDVIEPYYNHQDRDNIKFIIHEDVYFKYLKSLKYDEYTGGDRFNVLFDFVNDEVREESHDDLIKYIDSTGNWYIDNQKEQEMYESQLKGASILMYSVMAILISIIFISISNSRNVNMLTRMKEFGMLLSVGMNKKQLKVIIILESLIQTIIASIIAIILSYIAVYAMGTLMISSYSIHKFEISTMIFIMSIVLITIINSMTSIKPLDKIKELSLVDMMKNEK